MQKVRRTQPSPRFSLLLLEEGEDYLQDFIAKCSHGSTTMMGKLRLATRSLFFDPDDVRLPITRLPFTAMQSLEAKDTHRSEFTVSSSSSTTMKANNKDSPYDIRRHSPPLTWTFSLPYAPLHSFLHTASSLFQASKLPSKADRLRAMEVILRKVDEESLSAAFDTSRLVDYSERLVWSQSCFRISPLMRERGTLVITELRLYFQPRNSLAGASVQSQAIRDIAALARRRSSLRPLGLEVFFSPSSDYGPRWDAPSAFFVFSSEEVRESALCTLTSRVHITGSSPSSIAASASTSRLMEARGSLLQGGEWARQVALAWSHGKISNYDYLLYLNLAAGRTFNDLAQYPVMPWVLRNYLSQSIDLNDDANYRDLSLPMGALSSTRLSEFKKRFREMQADPESPIPPFLYGTHYSSPGYCMYWLLRSSPAQTLRLQNGRFDAADRAFSSIAESWALCLTSSTDVKELIPAFFQPSAGFLVNTHQSALGVRQCGKPVDDVELPPWAHNLCQKGRTPQETFLAINRAALESVHVSSFLHLWIDLIFGCKQKGQQAIDSDNLFFHLTYEGAVSDEAISRMDAVELQALEVQVQEFGQCPKQLFQDPHPPRLVCPPTPSFESFYPKAGLTSEEDDAISLISSIIAAIDDEALNVVQLNPALPLALDPPSSSQRASEQLVESAPQSATQDVLDEMGELGLLLKAGRLHLGQGASLPLSPSQLSSSLLDCLEDESHLKVKVIEISKDGPVNAALTIRDDLICCVCNNGLLRTVSQAEQGEGGTSTRTLRLEGDLLSLASIPSHSVLAVGSSLGAIHTLSTQADVRCTHSWTAHDDSVCCLSSSSSLWVSSSYDCSVKIWSLEGVQRDEIREFDSGVWALATSESSPELVFTGTEEGLVQPHDLRLPQGSSRSIWTARASRDYIGGIVAPEGKHQVIVAAADGCMSVLDSRMAGATVMTAKSTSPLRCLTHVESPLVKPNALAGNERGVIEVLDISSRKHKSWAIPLDSIANLGAINSLSCLSRPKDLRLVIAAESGHLVIGSLLLCG